MNAPQRPPHIRLSQLAVVALLTLIGLASLAGTAFWWSVELRVVVGFSILYAIVSVLGVNFNKSIYVGFENVTLFTVAYTYGVINAALVVIFGVLLAVVGRATIGQSLGWLPYRLPLRLWRGVANMTLTLCGLVWAIVFYTVVLQGQFPLTDANFLTVLYGFFAVTVFACLSVGIIAFLGQLPRSGTVGRPKQQFPEWLTILIAQIMPTPVTILLSFTVGRGRVSEFFILIIIYVLGAILFREAMKRQMSLTRRIQQLDVLNSTGQALAKTLSVSDLTQKAYTALSALSEMPLLYIAIIEPNTKTLSFPAVIERGDLKTWPPQAIVSGLYNHHYTQQRPVLLSGGEAAIARTLTQLGLGRNVAEYQGGAYMGIPLVNEKDVIGLLVAQHPTNPNAYSTDDFTVFGMVGNQIATSLHNIALYNDLYAIADRLATLNNIASLTNATLSLDELLTVAAEVSMEFSGAQHVAVYLLAEEDHALQLARYLALSEAYQALFSAIPLGDASDANSVAALIANGEMLSLTNFDVPPGTYWRPLAKAINAQALLAIPLVYEQSHVGLIMTYFDQQRVFRPGELHLIGAFIHQLAASMATARLFEDLRIRAADLTQLTQSSRAFASTLDLPSVAQSLFEALHRLVQPTWCTLRLLEPDGTLRLIHMYGRTKGLTERLRPFGAVAEALQTGKPVIGPLDNNDQEALIATGSVTLLAMPLVSSGQAVGVVTIGHNHTYPYTNRVLQLLEATVNQATLALRNAEVFELVDRALKERVAELGAIEAISRKISASLDIAEIIREVADVAVRNTEADWGVVPLLPPYTIYRDQSRQRVIYRDGTEQLIAVGQEGLFGVVGKVISTGQTVRAGDVSKLPEFFNITSLNIRSELCVPITHKDRRIGVINVESTRPDAFTEAHERFLQNLADHAAIALENVRLYEEARARSDQLGVVFNSAQEGLILLEADGRLALANPAAASLLHHPLSEARGQRINAPEPTGHWVAATYEWLAQFDSSAATPSERIYHLHGDQISRDLLESRLPILDPQGKLNGVLIVLRDVSQEEAAKQFQRDVTDMLVHDLRSPMTSVISSLKLLKELIAVDDYTDFEEVIDIALTSGQRQVKLIESLLDIAKLEKGQMLLNQAPVAAHALAQNAVTSLEPQARDAHITLLNLIDPDLPRLLVDEGLVGRVFTNLVDNAVRHTPNAGQARVEASLDDEHYRLKISVTDTGKGVPPDQRAHIFEKFVQIPKSTLRGHKGSGLGLTFCKLVIEAHGGKIWVESGPEGGAAFIFTLPLEERGQPTS